tara:strand:+ start:2843 stop:3100 length:258 start_codon:yes stop_codon:yes gene_type:complete
MFKKIFLLIIIALIIIFLYLIFLYYNSENNKEKIFLKRNNIDNSILNNSYNLPLLKNDTSDIINFNSGFSNINKKKRKFWELLNK